VAGASVQARARSSNTTRHPARHSAIVRSVSSASVSWLTPPTASSALRRNAPTAPGTVVMQRQRSCTRRSRLNPMTYSMCCQRATRPVRFATFALPATAPTSGCANGWTSTRTVSGSNTVSPSIITTRSWLAARMPVLSAAALPPLICRITRTPGSARPSTIAAVPSVEPSSTTMISTGWSLATIDATVAAMHSFSL
jgi:hypothetical protein